MAFGKKKDQEQTGIEVEPVPRDEDLAVAYGNGEALPDDLSLTDSIPPPPPSGDVTDTKKEVVSKPDSATSQSEGNDDADDSVDGKVEAEQIERKKKLLIAGCIVSFIIFLALAITYGQVRKQANSNAALSTGEEDLFETSPPTNTVAPDSNNITIDSDPELDVLPVVEPGNEETIAPTIDGTDGGTPIFSAPNLFTNCTANEISVLTTCNNRRSAAVSLDFCMVDPVTDQFWAWISAPPERAPMVASEWGWMLSGDEAEFPNLIEGDYEIGIFSNGQENYQFLNEYPLITSAQFTVDCRRQ